MEHLFHSSNDLVISDEETYAEYNIGIEFLDLNQHEQFTRGVLSCSALPDSASVRFNGSKES